jgi:type I restriction enzyme M protein
VAPASYGDYAWVQHMVASMRPITGRVGVVMPHGVLFRGGAEGAIRRCLVQHDQLEAVVGLPPNLFYSTSIPACLLIFRSMNKPDRRGNVLFVDGSRRFEKGRNQNRLRPADVDAIVEAYRNGADLDGEAGVLVRSVPHSEIETNGWDLNIGRYVRGTSAEEVSVDSALAAFAEAQSELREAEESFAERLREAGYA